MKPSIKPTPSSPVDALANAGDCGFMPSTLGNVNVSSSVLRLREAWHRLGSVMKPNDNRNALPASPVEDAGHSRRTTLSAMSTLTEAVLPRTSSFASPATHPGSASSLHLY